MVLISYCLWTSQSLIAFINLSSTPEKYECTIIPPLKRVNEVHTGWISPLQLDSVVKQGTEPMLYQLETTIFSSATSPSDQLFPFIFSDYLKLQMCLEMKTHQNIIEIFLNFQSLGQISTTQSFTMGLGSSSTVNLFYVLIIFFVVVSWFFLVIFLSWFTCHCHLTNLHVV